MPVQDLSVEHNSKARGAAYGSDRRTNVTLEESKTFFHKLLINELRELLAVAAEAAAAAAAAASTQNPRTSKCRSSLMLCMTGKRVSVSEEIIAQVQRRMSSQLLSQSQQQQQQL